MSASAALATQIVLILDVDDRISDDEVVPQLPAERFSVVPLRLSDFGAPRTTRIGRDRAPVDWDGLAQAVERLVERAKALGSAEKRRVDYFVVGKAPLPVFVHIGMVLSSWAGTNQTVLNRRPDQTWDVLPVGGSVTPGSPAFFDHVVGLDGEPRDSSGRVAVFISTGLTAKPEELREFVRSQGDQIAGIVDIRTKAQRVLDKTNVANAADEVLQGLRRVKAIYPHASDIALFVAGPASLAFLIGRALNPNVTREAVVADYTGGRYELAMVLPWHGRIQQTLNMDEGSEAARREVLTEIRAGVDEIRSTLVPDHLPSFMSSDEKRAFLEKLKALNLAEEMVGEAFELKPLHERATFGRGLLEALRVELQHGRLRRIGQALILHEVFHDDQGLRTSNFRDVGRAGFALEEIDYWADAMALSTIAAWEVGKSRTANPDVGRITCGVIEAALKGMEAFDRSEQGPSLVRLSERRLRRYLIWHLQLKRAETLARRADIDALFEERLFVELAPLAGRLDARFDKVVTQGDAATELFVVIGRRLLRESKRPGFDPAALVESARRFDSSAVHGAMDFVLYEHGGVLAPWKARS